MTTPALSRRAARRALGILVLVGTSASMAADLELVRLNACKDVSDVFATLNRTPSNCGAATGVIERTIRDVSAGSGAQHCFLERPPIASLSDFKCIQSSYRKTSAMLCYRSTTAELLDDYKANYARKFSARASTYLEEAKRCPGSNGDASRTIETTFPPILMPVAENEFGFNVQFGTTKPGTSTVTHGFARTSSDVSRRGPEAIEYVSFSTGPSSDALARTALGNWRLSVDTSTPDFAEPFLKGLRRQGLDAYLAFVDISMQRAPRASVLSKEPSLPDELSEVVASNLEDEGFAEMDDDDVKRYAGQTREEMSKGVMKGASFGARNLLSGRIPRIRLLMKTSGIPCTNGGRGAIGAYLFALDGEANVQVDFGSVSAMMLGFGACATSNGREYVRNIASQSKQTVLDDLKAR